MKYLKSYNESLRDKMKPKSNEEILKDLGDLSPEKLLFKSVENNYLNGVKIALEKGADINYKYDYGETILMYASKKGKKVIVEFLLKNGADINIQDNEGNTALLYASKNNLKDIVEFLIKNGADINKKNVYGNTALAWASGTGSGHEEIIELLKKYGAKE